MVFIKKGSKKAQITAYIIIGILIAVIVSAGTYLTIYFTKAKIQRELEKSLVVPEQVKPIKEYLDSCLTTIVNDGVVTLGMQGGYINMPVDLLPTTPVNPFSNKLEIIPGLKATYWFYETSNGIQKEQIPTIEDMEKELKNYVDENIQTCISGLRDFEDMGYIFEVSDIKKVDIKILNKKVLTELEMPVKVNLKGFSFDLKKHFSSVESSLQNLYSLALDIFEKAQKGNFLEERTLDMLTAYSEIPFSGTEFECGQKFWSKRETIEKLKPIVTENIAAIRVKGTSYTLLNPAYGYFVLNAKGSPNLNVAFRYSTDWPIAVEIFPSDGDVLKSDPISRNIGEPIAQIVTQFVCINNWHFIYNIKYPVLIQITDDKGYTFQYATMVIIDKNQPKKNIIARDIAETTIPLCKNKITNITVYSFSYDASGNIEPLYGTDISFKCFTLTCPIGMADADETRDSTLTAKFPQCLNGLVIGEKEGYYKGQTFTSTNREGTVSVILEPYYIKKFNVKLIDKNSGEIRNPYESEQIVFEFKNKGNDYSTSIIYPGTEEIKLIPGDYEIKSYVIANSTWPIEIKSEKIEKCIQVPMRNILGVFLTEEKCFTTEIEGVSLEQVIKGGASFGYSIERTRLINTEPITFYTMVDQIPTTYKSLSLVYEAIDKNAENLYFKYPE